MHWISLLLLGLTAGLFLYIMVLETFLTDSQLTARTFKMSVDELRKPALNTVMKNLGVYNGLVGAGLLYALLFSPDGREVAAVFFAFGLVVAIYGAISSQFSILFKQGTLPFLRAGEPDPRLIFRHYIEITAPLWTFHRSKRCRYSWKKRGSHKVRPMIGTIHRADR